MVRRLALALAGAATLGTATPAGAHPIHTTMTELRVVRTPGGDAMELVLRAFVDDFSAAVARHAGRPVPRDSSVPPLDAERYLRARLQLLDVRGRPLPVSSCGVRRAAELVWVCLRTRAGASLQGLTMANTVLTELYADQVNLVRAGRSGRPRMTIFVRGDGAKRLDGGR